MNPTFLNTVMGSSKGMFVLISYKMK